MTMLLNISWDLWADLTKFKMENEIRIGLTAAGDAVDASLVLPSTISHSQPHSRQLSPDKDVNPTPVHSTTAMHEIWHCRL